MQTVAKEQAVLMHIADIIIWTCAAESIVQRVQKLTGIRGSEEAVAHKQAIIQVYCYEVARYNRDIANALGGVRGVIPVKQGW
jgi:hypothetical protein